MISKGFFKSSFIYSIIGALPFISGLILTLLFTAKLTKEQIGLNALYFSFFYFFQIFSSFSLETFIGIHYFDYKDDAAKLKEFIGTVMVSLIGLGAVVFVVFSIGGTYIFDFIFVKLLHSKDLPFFPWGFMTLVTAVFTGFLKTYSNLLLNQQRSTRFLWINLLNFTFTIGVSIILLYMFPFTLIGPMWGRLVPAFISFATIMYFVIKEYNLSFNFKYLEGFKSFCIPIVYSSIFIWVVSYIDRYIIKMFLIDPTYVGIFDIAVKCTLVIDFIQLGLSNTVHPKIYTLWKDKNLKESTLEVNRYYHSISAVALIAIPLFIIAAPIAIPIVIKKEIYYQIFNFFPILCLGFVTRTFYYMFLAPIYFQKKTKVLPKIFMLSAVFQILSSFILIKYFGLAGAVWASFILKPVQAFIIYLESRKIFKFNFNKVKLFYLPLVYIIIVVLSELFLTNISLLIRSIGQFVIIASLVYFVYKNELMLLLNHFLKKE